MAALVQFLQECETKLEVQMRIHTHSRPPPKHQRKTGPTPHGTSPITLLQKYAVQCARGSGLSEEGSLARTAGTTMTV